jgi:hypothetical protein
VIFYPAKEEFYWEQRNFVKSGKKDALALGGGSDRNGMISPNYVVR